MLRKSGKDAEPPARRPKSNRKLCFGNGNCEYDSQNCSPEALQQAVQNAGYDLLIKQDENTPDKVEQAHDKKYRALKFRTTWAIVLSVPVMVIGMFFMDMPYANLIMWLFSTPVVFWLGRVSLPAHGNKLETIPGAL